GQFSCVRDLPRWCAHLSALRSSETSHRASQYAFVHTSARGSITAHALTASTPVGAYVMLPKRPLPPPSAYVPLMLSPPRPSSHANNATLITTPALRKVIQCCLLGVDFFFNGVSVTGRLMSPVSAGKSAAISRSSWLLRAHRMNASCSNGGTPNWTAICLAAA